ncbi:MAG: DUF3800 domain-containing protein [Rhodoglobus sp.]
MRPKSASEPIRVPSGYPTATVFIDESGSRASGSRFFVMGAITTRTPGLLARSLHAVRDKTGFNHEFKFSEITSGSLAAYYAAVDAIADSEAHIIASVVNRDQYDPFPGTGAVEAHANVAAQLLVGCINRRELVSVVLDLVSTPEGVSLDELVKDQVNRRFRNTSVVSAICADSKAMDLLQMADLVAGAIAFERRREAGENRKVGSNPNSPKAKVATRLLAGLQITSAVDQRTDRINIATLRTPTSRVKPLRIVSTNPVRGIETAV